MNVELINHMGTDLTIVDAARVSFDKRSNWEFEVYNDGHGDILTTPKLSERDCGLIRYLARCNHFTPFTHACITLRETVPIFVARQRFKHTVGFSYNEVSRRYVDDPPQFYLPTEWRTKPDGSVKQGSGEPHDSLTQVILNDAYKAFLMGAEKLYNWMLDYGTAPEMARMVLPQSLYTSYYVTGSLAAFARAYNLRSDPHAQLEIQFVASEWDRIIRPLYPESWSALVDCGSEDIQEDQGN